MGGRGCSCSGCSPIQLFINTFSILQRADFPCPGCSHEMVVKLKSQGDLDKETREYKKTHKKKVEKAKHDGKEGAQLPPCTNVPEMTYGCGNSIPVRENVPEAAQLACYWLSTQTQSPLGLLPKGKTTSWCFQLPRRGLAVLTHDNQKDPFLSKLYIVGFAIIY